MKVKDENFEMKVLDSLNASKCNELLQDIHLQGRSDDDVRYVKKFNAAREAAVVPPPLQQPSQGENDEAYDAIFTTELEEQDDYQYSSDEDNEEDFTNTEEAEVEEALTKTIQYQDITPQA
jgi:hypothetical protein